MSGSVELPIMHWISTTALSGIISNIGWKLFNHFGHAAIHSFSSAWHEFMKRPKLIFSLHAPIPIIGVVLAPLRRLPMYRPGRWCGHVVRRPFCSAGLVWHGSRRNCALGA